MSAAPLAHVSSVDLRAELARRAEGQRAAPRRYHTSRAEDAAREIARPRSECKGGARPCTLLHCRYSLDASRGESCALDVAERGGAKLEEVGDLLGITRERVRQIERAALAKLHRKMAKLEAEVRTPPPTMFQAALDLDRHR